MLASKPEHRSQCSPISSAPVILAAGGGSYSVLDAVAGVSAVLGAVAILAVEGVR
jgi:hypothetical protein